MAASKQPKILEAGSTAPEFRLARLDGATATLAEILSGGPALLAFFKISCPVCQLTLPYLERLHNSGTLRIFGISQNDESDTRDFNEDFGVTFPVLLDSEDEEFPASNAFGISSVPSLFLVERDGRVSRVIEGWRKTGIQELGIEFRPGDNVPEWKAG
jgi:peroxiredoxin